MKAARKQCSSSPRTPRMTTRTVTWNVRTMDLARKANLTARGMTKCKLAVIRMSETKWTYSGQTGFNKGSTKYAKLSVSKDTGLLHRGVPDRCHP